MDRLIFFLQKLNLISIGYANTIEDTPINFVETTQSGGFSVFGLIMFFITFLLIAGAMGLILYIVNNNLNGINQTNNSSIKLLDKINIDSNLTVYALKIQDEVLVLGRTENSLNTIKHITDEDKISILEIDCVKKISQQKSFNEVLSQCISNVSNTNKNKGSFVKAKAFNSRNDR